MSGKIISVVNRKGGVGKTTLSVALADAFISEFAADVALVDLDPQGSASRMLMSDEEFESTAVQDKNLVGLMRSGLDGERLSLGSAKLGMRHKIRGREGVNFDLFANSDRFWDLEAEEVRRNNAVLLRAQIEKLLALLTTSHRFIIIDCPPGQAFSTAAALSSSDLILVPTTPDRLSIWGMDLFRAYAGREAPEVPFKFVVTRYQSGRREARASMEDLSGQSDMLRTVGGSASAYGDFDFAVLSESENVRRRIRQDSLQTLRATYGDRGALELANIARAVSQELKEDG